MRFFGSAIVVTACWAIAAHAAVPRPQTVTAARLVEAARASLPAAGDSTITRRALAAPPDAIVPAGTLRLQTRPLAGRWPRARVAVPVGVFVNGKPVRTETVWFAVKALQSVWVYDQDTPAGSPADKLKMHKATVDVAEADGRPVGSLLALANDRLKRGVHAGWPLLEGDFEAIPDVDKQSRVIVHVRYGPIRIETMAMALGAGDVGDVVPVLVEGAASPVQAKVAGKGEVDIAR